MKSVEGRTGQGAGSSRAENIKPLASNILKALAELEKPYGQGYLARLLKGDMQQELREVSHVKLQCFGSLAYESYDKLFCTFQLLTEHGLLKTNEPHYSTYRITEEGIRWLQAPRDWYVAESKIKYRPHQLYLRNHLRVHRSESAKQLGMEPWLIFTDFMLDALVRHKPRTLQALSKVPGFDHQRCEDHGAGVLATISESLYKFEELKRESRRQKVKRGEYPKVKKMFSEGFQPQDIALSVQLPEKKVFSMLRELHSIEEVDLEPWAKSAYPKADYFRAMEYFQNVQNPRVDEALNTLGLDLELLLTCRFIVSDFKQKQDQIDIVH